MVGKRQSSEPPEAGAAEQDGGSRFQNGARVLALNEGQLYVAKIQKKRRVKDGNGWEYYIHYHGWKARWDEWAKDEQLHEDTEAGRQLQDRLAKEMAQKNAAKKSNKVDDAFAGDDGEDEIMRLNIPYTLQKQLLDDGDMIKDQGKLIPLPRKPTVAEVLEGFLESRPFQGGCEQRMLKDMVDGINLYFNRALGMMLLYEEERGQYEKIKKEQPGKQPNKIYGTEHLLRLLVKLPFLLGQAGMDPNVASTHLHSRIVELLRHAKSSALSL